jgi:hypothetical protein
MSQNTGTLITASIRPNDSLDPIASAFSSEIKGGVHSKESISDRDNIIEERRDWGMLCYVKSEDKTYQLIFDEVDEVITNNNNWVEFSSGESSGSSQWLDSVKSIITSPVNTPQTGSRYLGGLGDGDSLTGIWDSKSPGIVFEWNSSEWLETEPNNGDSIRINDQKNAVYRYDGVYPGGNWVKENLNQVLEVNATSQNGILYQSTTETNYDEYIKNAILLTSFDTDNENTQPSININGLGAIVIKKASSNGLVDLIPNDIKASTIYTLLYTGQFFQLIQHYSSDSLKIKNKITVDDYIIVPENHQYWIYGDLEIEGTLLNYGEVIISNGSLVLIDDGVFDNQGELNLISLIDSLSVDFSSTNTIQVTEEQSLDGMSYTFDVIDKSLDVEKLDTGTFGNAVNGYVLTNEDGKFKWVSAPSGGGGVGTSDTIYQIENPTAPINGNNQYTGIDISGNPNQITSIRVFINGLIQLVGNGTFSEQCYFSDDGLTALAYGDIKQGSGLYFNSIVSGYDLSVSDTVLILYEV